MARVVIELDNGCDPCWKKRVARESVTEIVLDGKTWFICEEHERALAREFVNLLGDPMENEGDK